MNYKFFPFGKYKGTPLTELPSTYIVLALEQFFLPKELEIELRHILLGRLKCFTSFRNNIKKNGLKNSLVSLEYFSLLYEEKEVNDG